jgi:predicted DNA-binding ArsR family transcriptional regulator
MSAASNRLEIYEGASGNSGVSAYLAALGGTGGGAFRSTVSPAYVSLGLGGASLNGSNAYAVTITDRGSFSVRQPRISSGGSASIQALGGISSKAYVFANLGGGLTASTSTSGISDYRTKRNVSDSDLGLDFISKLRPVKFKWVDGENSEEVHRKKYHYGLIAQEVKESLEVDNLHEDSSIIQSSSDSELASYKKQYPELAEELSNSPLLSLDYIQLVPALIKAIQDMSSKIESLETEIDLLKNGNT